LDSRATETYEYDQYKLVTRPTAGLPAPRKGHHPISNNNISSQNTTHPKPRGGRLPFGALADEYCTKNHNIAR
jgi:hypothetical protein